MHDLMVTKASAEVEGNVIFIVLSIDCNEEQKRERKLLQSCPAAESSGLKKQFHKLECVLSWYIQFTISFAAFPHQQFDDAQETLGCSQVQRPVTHLTTHIHICTKLQQQLCQLGKCKVYNHKEKLCGGAAVVNRTCLPAHGHCSKQYAEGWRTQRPGRSHMLHAAGEYLQPGGEMISVEEHWNVSVQWRKTS